MTTKQIEELATGAVRLSMSKTSLLSPYISENDKEPSWDGSVYLYSDCTQTKQSFRGKAPVQVKGKVSGDFSKDTISYSAETADLQNYRLDGGALYFVVYVHPETQETKIYYDSLTLDKLNAYLDKCKAGQRTRKITLKAFPQSEADKIKIIRDFISQYRPLYNPRRAPARDISENEYKGFLSGIACQRLTDDPKNLELIQSFSCQRDNGTAYYLKYVAWDEDRSGDTAYYLIKDQKNQILMYFSLKCGSLFEPLNREKYPEERNNLPAQSIWEILARHPELLFEEESKEKKTAKLDKLLRDYGIDVRGLNNMRSYRTADFKIPFWEKLAQDDRFLLINRGRQKTSSRNTIQVSKQYSAVELVHLSINDSARETWEKLLRKYGVQTNMSMGTILFLFFVVPVICSIQKTVGCRYAYLFAADTTAEQKLVRYYERELGFSREGNIGPIRPRYNYGCEFMYQEIDKLKSRWLYHFDQFLKKQKHALL